MTHLQREPKAEEYAPYHTMLAFALGMNGFPPGGRQTGVEEQAYDRGLELNMRLRRWNERNQHERAAV